MFDVVHVERSLHLHIMDVNEKKNPFVCHLCKSSLVLMSLMRQHIRSIHSMIPTPLATARPLQRERCSSSVTGDSSLRVHTMDKHNKKGRFVCHLCAFSFVSKSSMGKHIRSTHSTIPAAGWSSSCRIFCSNAIGGEVPLISRGVEGRR